jgi:hypothetical protein
MPTTLYRRILLLSSILGTMYDFWMLLCGYVAVLNSWLAFAPIGGLFFLVSHGLYLGIGLGALALMGSSFFDTSNLRVSGLYSIDYYFQTRFF